MANSNNRAELERKIAKYRLLSRQVLDHETTRRINGLIAELEQRRQEIDE